MNNQPRQILTQLIKQHGPAICNEPLRLKAMLRDLCDPQHKREVNILGFALDERIPHDLLNAGAQSKFQLPRLSQRLQDAYAMSEEAAKWAVESWALALGVLSPTELKSVVWQTNSSQATSSRQPSATASQTSANNTAAPSVQTLIVDQQGGGDYTDIKEAIKNALAGARIIVRAGTYEGNLTIEKPLQIVGDGLKDDIIIKIDKNKYDSNALVIHSNRVFIENITFSLNQNFDRLTVNPIDKFIKSIAPYYLIWQINEKKIKVMFFHIIVNNKSSLAMKNCNVYGGSNAIRNFDGQVILEECNIFSCYRGVVSSGSLTIRRSKISNMIKDGIYIDAGQNVLIEDSEIIHNGVNGVYVRKGNVTLKKCNIRENGDLGIYRDYGTSVDIQDCKLEGNSNGVSNLPLSLLSEESSSPAKSEPNIGSGNEVKINEELIKKIFTFLFILFLLSLMMIVILTGSIFN